ncbi:MAG: Rrf2 family transcriptional regulator [Patescibacteria group bacterium]
MKISKKAEYGLTAMVHLAKNLPAQAGKNNKAISIRQISNIEGVPFEFLSKIFSSLEKGGLVTARHGANGGYSLAKSPDKIVVADIIKLLEDIKTVNCQMCIRSKKCLAKNVWSKIDKAVNKTLNSIKLSELIK